MKLLTAFVLGMGLVAAVIAGEPRLVVREIVIVTTEQKTPGIDQALLTVADSVYQRERREKGIKDLVLPERSAPRDWRTNRSWDSERHWTRDAIAQDSGGAQASMRVKVDFGVQPDSVRAHLVERSMTAQARYKAAEADSEQAALADTSPNVGSDGRVYFNLIAPAPREAWTVRTPNGTRWTLTHTGSLRGLMNPQKPHESWTHVLDSLKGVDSTYARQAKSWDEQYALARNDTAVAQFTTSSAAQPGLVTAFAWGDSAIVEYIASGGNHHVLINGSDVNAERGYEDCFHITLLVGRPFWFYSQNGGYGWFYNGTEFDGTYQQIVRDDSSAEETTLLLTPVVTPAYFRAYAQRGDVWFLLQGRIEEK